MHLHATGMPFCACVTPERHATIPVVGELAKTIREINQSIQHHEEEIARLRAELQDAREALAETAPSKTRRKTKSAIRRAIRATSNVGWARSILKAHGKPMHIDTLQKHIEEMSGLSVRKTTLVSNLSRYVRAQDTFTRPEESKYGLLDWTSEVA